MTQTRCWAWTCALTLTLAVSAAWSCDKEHACQAPQTQPAAECSPYIGEPVAPCYPVGSCGMHADSDCSTSCGTANPGCARKGRKCCCDGSTPCVEGCKPDACPCEETPSCKVKKSCACDHSKCCSEKCKGEGCCCKDEGCCCKCEHCGKCCKCPAGKVTILICPCPAAPLLGLIGSGCPCNCLACVADLIANCVASSFPCEMSEALPAPAYAPPSPPACAMAPCGFAPPMPPMPGMPPIPPIPGAFCPPMPQIMPCMVPAQAARPPMTHSACKWTLRHESDAIHISGPNMEATCEKVTYCGEGDWVVLEGHVQLKYHKNGDKGAVSAGRLAINVEDGSVNLNVAGAPEESTSANVFQFWSGFCH